MYANSPPWVELSDGTRLVKRLAEKLIGAAIPPGPADHIRAVQTTLKDGKKLPELIAAEGSNGMLILIEGHCRATAYVGLGWKENIPVFLASSSSMHRWHWY